MSASTTERVEVVYAGRVQGVGFRASTRAVARHHDVAGWVRNEPDGTVRLIAEGEREELDRFLRGVREAMERHVESVRVERSRPTGEFDGFEIRHRGDRV